MNRCGHERVQGPVHKLPSVLGQLELSAEQGLGGGLPEAHDHPGMNESDLASSHGLHARTSPMALALHSRRAGQSSLGQLAKALLGDAHSNARREEQQARGSFGAMAGGTPAKVFPIDLVPCDEPDGVEPVTVSFFVHSSRLDEAKILRSGSRYGDPLHLQAARPLQHLFVEDEIPSRTEDEVDSDVPAVRP